MSGEPSEIFPNEATNISSDLSKRSKTKTVPVSGYQTTTEITTHFDAALQRAMSKESDPIDQSERPIKASSEGREEPAMSKGRQKVDTLKNKKRRAEETAKASGQNKRQCPEKNQEKMLSDRDVAKANILKEKQKVQMQTTSAVLRDVMKTPTSGFKVPAPPTKASVLDLDGASPEKESTAAKHPPLPPRNKPALAKPLLSGKQFGGLFSANEGVIMNSEDFEQIDNALDSVHNGIYLWKKREKTISNLQNIITKEYGNSFKREKIYQSDRMQQDWDSQMVIDQFKNLDPKICSSLVTEENQSEDVLTRPLSRMVRNLNAEANFYYQYGRIVQEMNERHTVTNAALEAKLKESEFQIKELRSELKKKEQLKVELETSNGLVDSFKKFFREMAYMMQDMSNQLYKYEDMKQPQETKERSIHLMLTARDLVKRVLPNVAKLMPYGQEEKSIPTEKNVVSVDTDEEAEASSPIKKHSEQAADNEEDDKEDNEMETHDDVGEK